MDNMERRQNEELLEARRLRRQEQKRRLLMRQRVLVIVLLVIVILSLILILRGCRNRREHPELYVKKDNALELQTEPDATVNIAAVGDIMITDDLLADARQPDGSYQIAQRCGPAVSLPKALPPCPAIRSRRISPSAIWNAISAVSRMPESQITARRIHLP